MGSIQGEGKAASKVRDDLREDVACEPKPEDGKGVGCVVLGSNSQCKGPVAAQRLTCLPISKGAAGNHAECPERCLSGGLWATIGHYVPCEVDWGPDLAFIYIPVRIRQRLVNPCRGCWRWTGET